MRQRRLGSAGLDVSAQGLGCMGMTFGYGAADASEAIATIHRALELGVTLLDTADMYGPHTNEELIGRAVVGRRDQVVLASKVGNEIGHRRPVDLAGQRPPRLHPPLDRGHPAPPWHRVPRPLLPAPGRPGRPRRGELRRARRPRAAVCPAPGHLRGRSDDHPARARGASADRRADRVLAVHPGRRSQRRAGHRARTRHRLRRLQPARPRLPDRRHPGHPDIPEGMDFRRIAPRFTDENIRRNLPVSTS